MIDSTHETRKKTGMDDAASDGSNESTVDAASTPLTAKKAARTVEPKIPAEADPASESPRKVKRRTSSKKLHVMSRSSSSSDRDEVSSSPKKSSRRSISRQRSSAKETKGSDSPKKRSDSPRKKLRSSDKKVKHSGDTLEKRSKHDATSRDSEDALSSSKHRADSPLKKSKREDALSSSKHRADSPLKKSKREDALSSSKHRARSPEKRSKREDGLSASRHREDSDKKSRREDALSASRHREDSDKKSRREDALSASRHREDSDKKSRSRDGERKTRRSTSVRKSRRSKSPAKIVTSPIKRSARSPSPTKPSKSKGKKPTRNRSDASQRSTKKKSEKSENEVNSSRGRSSRREETAEGGKRKTRGGSRKPMKERQKAKQSAKEDKASRQIRRCSSIRLTNSPEKEMKSELNFFFKKVNQATAPTKATGKMARRGSTGSQMLLTAEERTVTSASIAPPPPPGSPAGKPKKAIMAPPITPDAIQKPKLVVKKKVWFASEETNTYRVNEMMNEEEVKTLWYDVHELHYFKETCNEAVIEITDNSPKANEWRQQILEAFEIFGPAGTEDIMEEAQKATYKLKDVYADSVELVGLEHLFVDDVKFDGFRRRGKMLDFVDKLYEEREYRRRMSQDETDEEGESVRLSNECLECSRPSRFFFHAVAVARLAAGDT